MTTIDELIDFCKEEAPVGALMLSGEWGCGKSYLMDHEFKDSVEDFAVVLRISLFGMMEIDEIHDAINNAWIDEYCKQKKVETVLSFISKGQKLLGKLDFLPDSIKGIGTTNLSDCVPIKNIMNGKSVVLVFDDLERCHISTVDVLGVINDYSENLKYHTIVIANQEKIVSTQSPMKFTAEFQYGSNTRNGMTDKKQATIEIKKHEDEKQGDISYTEIKEKIIQRTVQYQPDYNKIISKIIDDLKCGDEKYREFVSNNKDELLELFAPDERLDAESSQGEKRPHNIRSLRCAINDFYRVYLVLKENEFNNIQYWLYSFVAYVISYKADIVKEGCYGTLFSDEQVHVLYPAFDNNYIFSAVKNWILHGIWDSDAIAFEINARKKRFEVKKPSEIIRYNRIMDVDEEVFIEGFDGLLTDVYQGNLSLDEYVLFIENSCWARRYEFEFPKDIDWDKVNTGINICIEKIKEYLPEGQLLYTTIGDNDKLYFKEEEWGAYETIYNFAFKGIMYYKNKMLYLDAVKSKSQMALAIVQNKRLNIFDEEMSVATSEAFLQLSNADKIDFKDKFERIWKANISSEDFDKKVSQKGFAELKRYLIRLGDEYKEKEKTFAFIHTKNFIEIIDGLMSSF